MNAVQLYVQSKPFGPTAAPMYTWYLLDLYEADPIKLSLSVASITDPLKVASAYTRTFRIPNTQKNSEFFNTAFLLNTEDFDPARKVPAYINQNGETLVNGSIRLNSIIRNQQKQAIAYEIGFFGETSDFATNIAGKYMSDLNMTMFNHVRNAAAIQNSWTPSGILGGAIRYPLIEWGYTYDSTPAPTIPTLSNGFSKSFTSTANPLKQSQFKPAIKLKVLWDAVISQTVQATPGFSPYTPQVGISGYTYSTDSFMNSSIFGNLYVIISDGATAELLGNNFFASAINYSIGFYANAGQDSFMYATDEQQDPGNNFVPTTSIYTAPATGNYVFQVNNIFGYTYTGGSPGGIMQGKIKIKITPLVGAPYYIYAPGGTLTFVGGLTQNSGNINVPGLVAGSKVQFVLEMNASGGPYLGTSYWVRGGMLQCTLAPQLMNIQQLMPNNIKITDFIKAVVDRFKLVFIPNKDNPREFKIIPWVNWVRTGEAKDWTTKLDISKEFKMTPLWEGLTRNNVFKDAEDADYPNYNYTLATKQTFGQLNLDSNNELLVGETVRTSIFAPTPLDSIANASVTAPGIEWNKMLIPKIAKDTTGARQPIQPKLRLVFWNGLKDNTGVPSATFKWYMQSDTVGYVGTGFTTYPLVSQFQDWPANASGSLNLSWKFTNPVYNVAYGPTANPTGATNLTQYNAYWQPWYSLVYNKYAKLVEATFNLDYMDIKELRFNDKVWVNDAWFLIDSVSDYIIGNTTNVKVRMYKISNDLGVANLSGVTILPPTKICFGVTACNAKCCNGGNSAKFNVYTPTPGTMVAGVSVVYMDAYGDIPAAPGYYSTGGTVWQVGTAGFYISSSNPTCSCTTGSGGVSMRTAYSAASLDSVSCTTPIVPPTEVYVWGRQSDILEDNIDFFIDSEMTEPAPSGFYRYLDYEEDPGVVVNVFEGTYNYTTDIAFTNCPAPSEYFPYVFGYSLVACDACCFTEGTTVYWSIDSTLTPGSILYSDFGITIAPDGEYSDGSFYYTIDTGTGEITGSADCACSCTPLVDIDLEMVSNEFGFSGSITLDKSFNAIDWIPVGAMDFPDTTPAGTPVTDTYQVEERAYTRASADYAGTSGTLYLEYLINDKVILVKKAALPLVSPVIIESPDFARPGVTRKWRVTILG